jgi:hypothetical protein
VISGELSTNGHAPTQFAGAEIHDIMLEIEGPGKKRIDNEINNNSYFYPACTDMHHSFVQRWNEANGHTGPTGSWPNLVCAKNMNFPLSLVPRNKPAGSARVQVEILLHYLPKFTFQS